MRKDRGFSNIILLVLLGVGLIVAVFLIGQQTGFFNQAAKFRPATTDQSPWGTAIDLKNNSETKSVLVASSSASLTNVSALSIDFWVKPTEFPKLSWATLVSKAWESYITGIGPNWAITIDQNGFLTLRYPIKTIDSNVQSSELKSTQALKLNTWQHVRVTFSGGDARIYVDGTQVGAGQLETTTLGYVDDTADKAKRNVTIGGECRGNIDGVCIDPSQGFNGQIDELRIQNTVDCMANTCPVAQNPYTVQDNDFALWHFDTKENNVTPDSTTNKHDAAYFGQVVFVESTVPFVQTQHLACVNSACILVPGSGENNCKSDSECTTPHPIGNNLLTNSGFELDTNPKDNLPDGWIARRLDKNDGLTPTKYEGKSSFRFSPYDAAANAKKDVKNELIRQVVTKLKGKSKDTITLEFWDSINSFNRRDGSLAAAIALKLGSKIVSVNGILLNTSTPQWKKHVVTTEAQGDYDTVVVNFYNNNTKTAWWIDSASLVIVPNGVAAGINPTVSTIPTDILQALQEN